MFTVSSCTVFYFVAAVSYAVSIYDDRLERDRRQVPDECRPFASHHHHHHHAHHNSEENTIKMPPICCDLPEVMPASPETFGKCHEMVFGGGQDHGKSIHKRNVLNEPNYKIMKRSSGENKGDDSQENNNTPPPPMAPDFLNDKKECFFNCIFNTSGFLTGDGQLNEDVLNQKLLQTVANNTKWTTTIDPVFKKCVAAAKEANSQSQKSCKQGAGEYLKCMTRELFFNCPNDLWANNPECNELKNKLEKCPNLWPPNRPAFRQDHNHHHRHHHHSEHKINN